MGLPEATSRSGLLFSRLSRSGFMIPQNRATRPEGVPADRIPRSRRLPETEVFTTAFVRPALGLVTRDPDRARGGPTWRSLSRHQHRVAGWTSAEIQAKRRSQIEPGMWARA